jgi:hypothetical protein
MVRRELVPAVSPPRSRPSAGYRARLLRASLARSLAALAGAAFLTLPVAVGSASTSPSGDLSLSNEWNASTWAYAAAPAPIYARPDRRARRVDHVHLETEDGFPEVYLLLSLHTDAHGQAWVKLRIPGRPNGRTGWVLRPALGAFRETRWLLVIDLRRRALTAYFDGRVRFRAPVGIGKPSSPTPPGRFWVRERFPIADRSSAYWPYAIGTSDYSTLTDWPGGGIVGIHGDFGEPLSIPGDPSHGCVRMRDSDIAWLAPRITLGTPLRIE